MHGITFSKTLKALMPSYHKFDDINSSRLHHLSKTTSNNFDIFKKTLDLGKDIIRSHIHLIQRLNKYFPLLGLVVGIIGLSLQLLIILFDKQHSRKTKFTAGALFTGLIFMAISACVLAVNAPIISGAIGISISFFTFLTDGYQLKLNLKRLFNLKKRKKDINDPSYQNEKLKQLQILAANQVILYKNLKKELQQLIVCENYDKSYEKQLRKTHTILFDLVDCDKRIQLIKTEPEALAKAIHEQSKSIAVSATSLTINVLSISLALVCLVACGSVPWGFSVLLALIFIVDLVELSKNMHNKRIYDRKQEQIETEDDTVALKHLQHASTDLCNNKAPKSSHERILKVIPPITKQTKYSTDHYEPSITARFKRSHTMPEKMLADSPLTASNQLQL